MTPVIVNVTSNFEEVLKFEFVPHHHPAVVVTDVAYWNVVANHVVVVVAIAADSNFEIG